MSHSEWRRYDESVTALDRILDAAGQVFADVGVQKATMVDVGRAAGCSRATLYRYFPNRESLHLAFVHRATLRIAASLAPDQQPPSATTLADRILGGIQAVRSDPLLAVWFTPENMAVPIALSQNSDLLQAMSSGLVGTLGTNLSHEDVERRGEWLLRSIVALLAMPAASAERERELVASFLIPVLTTQPDHHRSPR